METSLEVAVAPRIEVLLPDLGAIRALVLDSVTSPHSRRAYGQALDHFLGWYGETPRGPLRRALVQEYRAQLETLGLASSTINVRLAAIRKLASEAAENGLLDRELASGIAKVKGAKRHGVRAGNWLTREQAKLLLQFPDRSTLKGKRDHAVLALLIGCGLRRTELAQLTLEVLQQREGRWVLIDLEGKGRRVRSVPVPAWVKIAIDEWIAAAGISSGRLLRAINKGGAVWGEGVDERAVWTIVEANAHGLVDAGKLGPHDLRRTCAKLCRGAGGELEQIQLLLGHASIQTTERYLGTKQNLSQAVNDGLGLED